MNKIKDAFFPCLILTMMAILFFGDRPVSADVSYRGALAADFQPIFAMGTTNTANNLSTTPATAITDQSDTSESNWQRLLITNLDTANNLCVFWVAAGASCTGYTCDGSGTDNGIVIQPGSSWAPPPIAGDLRTCVVASAASTDYQVARIGVGD